MKRCLMGCLAALAAEVTLAGDPFAGFASAESDASAAVRVENRVVDAVAARVVTGVVTPVSSEGALSAAWDTTREPNGWRTVTDAAGRVPSVDLLVLNAPGYRVEGGRLEASVVWTADAVHWVRNWVVVPRGVTLTVAAGAVVKFGNETGIKVEDGGAVKFEGNEDSRVVLTHFADDAYGGDSDFGRASVAYGEWSVTALSGGTVGESFTHVRYGTVGTLATISLPASVVAQRIDGKARIPVALSGTGLERVALHWRAIDGTAKFGTDYAMRGDETVWTKTASETVYLEIPLIEAAADDEVRTFRVEVVSTEDVNPNPERLVTTVTIVSGTSMPVPKWAASDESAAVRLENRDGDAVGRALVRGVELKASDPDSAAVAWDTTQEPEGWQEIADARERVPPARVLVRNDEQIAVEGGRLTASETWTPNVIHVVRNTVVVPSGVTLTVVTNAVVKFCENTGVKVESGGSLVVVGDKDRQVVFTAMADDAAGGDTDMREGVPPEGSYAIDVVTGGTLYDSYATFRHADVAAFPTVSLPGKCEINESEQQVQIPVLVSGSRTTPFRVYWRAVDGTAEYPADYTVHSGVIEWNGTADGTHYITVPVCDGDGEEEAERFTVELYDAQGANICASSAACVVTVRDSTAGLMPEVTWAESEASEAVRLENRSDGTIGKAVVRGVEHKAANGESRAVAWDTTQEPEGWQEIADAQERVPSVRVLVRNDERIAVEGGRLTANAVWDSNTVHLVRNTVVVPSGVTLSVTTNAVVKFCENTGVKVEAGGRFELLGSLEESVCLTLANDDTVGGDTDGEENRGWADGAATYSVEVVSGGVFTDMNAAIRGTTVDTFGFARVDAETIVDASEGVIRIPVFVSGSRTTQFSVDWKTSDGHAGQLVWGKAGEGTKWVTLDVGECSGAFAFELCESRGINIDDTARASEVTVYANAMPRADFAESEASAAVRFETRAEGTFGKALCRGIEWKSANGETRAEEWDTTREDEGWLEIADAQECVPPVRMLVRNDEQIAVEGGRIAASVVWSNDVTHVVRNWVVVPSGVTLTIAAGTVVKFAELTGIKVEAGGRVSVEGTVETPVVYTAAADDTIGGDTDRREVEPQYGDYSVNVVSGGTYDDRNCAIRYATFANLGTATLPGAAVANEKDGVVRVPLFVSTSRTTAFCVDWRVRSGAYAAQGRLNWKTYTEGTKYIEIPLTRGTVAGEFDTFEIELYESQGINVSTTERKCVVTIYPDRQFPAGIAYAESGDSAAVRMENRDPFESVGAAVVCGVERKSADGESPAETWDTTREDEGWCELSDGEDELWLLVRNDPSLAVEGGRLTADATWTSDRVRLVRNWVVVPNGVTLTIAAGTVVKFCDETGIKVEAGGRLVTAGTAEADVVLTTVSDDTVGGDTDIDEATPEHGCYRIDVVSGGTFTDTNTQLRYGESGTFGEVSVAAAAVAKKDGGVVRIPVTVNTSRNTPFAVDWVAHDGTAAYGEDYRLASGRIVWTSSSQGTKYLEIPLNPLAPKAEGEWFEIELTAGLGVNLDLGATVCTVDLYDTKNAFAGDKVGLAESKWCVLGGGEVDEWPSVADDPEATVTGDAETGFVVKPSAWNAAVEVTIPHGVEAAKVTVEVSPKVTSVKPNGASVKVVSGGADITGFLNMPTADARGVMDLTTATVKEEIVREVLDPAKGAVVELTGGSQGTVNPAITTAPTREGLFYQFREGETLDGMKDGDRKVGDGKPWSPEIKVKGGISAFYSIGVGKGE